MPLAPLLARGGVVQGLAEGDPVTWGLLVLALIFAVVMGIYRFRQAFPPGCNVHEQAGPSRDDVSK